jgi:hypothetical protein
MVSIGELYRVLRMVFQIIQVVINMKKIVYINLLCTLVFNCRSQYLYLKQDSVNTYYFSPIFKLNSPNILVLSKSQVNNWTGTNKASKILEIDPKGKLVNSVPLDSQLILSAQLVRMGSHYYVLGTKYRKYSNGDSVFIPTIYKFDANLNFQLALSLDSAKHILTAQKMIQKGQELFVVTNSLNNFVPDSLFFYKTNPQLSQLSKSSNKGYFMEIANYGAGILLAAQGIPQCGTGTFIAHMDTAFQVINCFDPDSVGYVPQCNASFDLGTGITNIIETAANKYLIWSSSAVPQPAHGCIGKPMIITNVIENNNKLLKTSLSGIEGYNNVSLHNGFMATRSNQNIYGIALSAYHGCLFPVCSGSTRILIQKMDLGGNIKWVRYFGGDMFYYPVSITSTPDSGVVICGIRYDTLAPLIKGIGESFILRYNQNGEIVTSSLHLKDEPEILKVKCFPNPTIGKVHFEIASDEEFQIVILDQCGREVIRLINYKNLSALDISILPKGFYFYKGNSSFSNFSGKFVLE